MHKMLTVGCFFNRYLALIIFTAGSLFYWITVCIIPYPNRQFIIRHLEMSELPFDPQGGFFKIYSILHYAGSLVVNLIYYSLHYAHIFKERGDSLK